VRWQYVTVGYVGTAELLNKIWLWRLAIMTAMRTWAIRMSYLNTAAAWHRPGESSEMLWLLTVISG
jgi:hypothetical protein